MAELDKDAAVGILNRILEAELAGVVRYTRYPFLVFGFGPEELHLADVDKMLRKPGELRAFSAHAI